MIPAMGIMTVSDRLRIKLKTPPFQADGVMPTSPTISPTLVFTVSNIPDRLPSIPLMSNSLSHSVCLSSMLYIGDYLHYPKRPESSDTKVMPMRATPPTISCFMTWIWNRE